MPPGLCGAWFAGSGPSRYGDFTLNYNFQAIWYGAYSTNHADTAMPYYRAILDYANGPGLVDSAHYVSTRVPALTLANPIARRPNISESHSETRVLEYPPEQ